MELAVAANNAAPGTTLLSDLVAMSTSGKSLLEIADSLASSASFVATYPTFQTANEFATEFLGNLVPEASAAAVAEGVTIIEGMLAGGSSRGAVILEAATYLAALDETNASFGTSAALFNHKVEVATYHTITSEAAAPWSIPASVTSSDDSVATGKSAVDTALAPPAPPAPAAQAFTLTTGADVKTLGDGADSFASVIGTNGLATNGTTLQAGDNLDGGAGDDTLTIAISGTHTGAVTTNTITLGGIETLKVSNYESSANLDTIDLSLASGINTLALYGSAATGDVTFTGVQSIAASQMWNGSGDLTVTYAAAAVAGTADTASLTLANTSAGTFTSAGIETLDVVSAGSSATNTITAIATGHSTVNVSGSVAASLGTIGTAATKTVNAADLTGKLTATVAGTGDTSITLGSGGSVITMTADAIDKNDTITGGAGSDRLIIDDAAMTTATLAGITGVEILDYDVASTITLTKASDFTTFDFDDAGNQSLILSTGYTGDVTVDITGDAANADVITNTAAVGITVVGNDTDFDATTDINGSTKATEVLNIKATGGTAVVTGAGAIDNVDKVVVVDGTAGSDITIDVNAYATALEIDATALDAGTGAADEILTVSNVAGAALTVHGGGGADVIQDSAKNDTINGNGGKDVITANQGGDDTINGGDGDDTINMANKLTAADTIDGGAGNDTLNVTAAVTAATLAGVSNVETLGMTVAGAVSLAADLGDSFTAIDLKTSTNSTALTLAAGFKQALTVSVEDGDSVINTAAVALTVNADADDLEAADNTVLTGSTKASETLNITNNAAATVDLQTDVTGFNTVNILDKTAGTDIGLNITGHGTAAQTLTINASELDDGEDVTITGQATANLDYTGGAGVDTVVLGTGNDTVNTGAGKDVIVAGTSLDNLDTVDGGDGVDTITATSAVDVNFINVSNVEQITATTAATLAAYAQAAGIVTAVSNTGAATNIDASSYTTGITIVAAAGNETHKGGTADDTFVFQATETLDANDTINGGTGIDTIRVDNDDDADKAGDAVTVVLDANHTAIEKVVVNDIASTDTNGDVTVTVNAGSTLTALTIDGSALDAGEVLTVGGSNQGAKEVLTVVGGAGDDVITTGAAADSVDGGAGADTITVGTGADSITTGAGADTVVYTIAAGGTGTGSTTASTDTIGDFTAKSDNIQLTVALANGGVTVDYNDKGDAVDIQTGQTLLTGVKGQYFFNTGTSQLMVDTDGNGLIQATDFVINTTGLTAWNEGDLNLVITGGTGADTITTGDGDDVITGGNGIDTVTTGGGSDKVSYFGVTAAANAVNVSDFTTASDKVQFSDASLAVDAGAFTAGTAVAATTVALVGAGRDVANEIIIDTAANLGALGVSIGNESGNANNVYQIAIESDTGKIFYDADGNWTGGSVQIGLLTLTGTITAANVEIIA